VLPLRKVQRANQNSNEKLATGDMAGARSAMRCEWRLAIGFVVGFGFAQ